MKRRETNKGWEDRLSGMMPDPERLSAVSRSTLVRAGSRWLSFAGGLSRGRGRTLAAADTLAFIESLYGGKFKAIEGGAFSLDKVYRTTGGGLFVSETRLSVSVHPRFDLRLLNITAGRAGSQVLRESHAMTLLSHSVASGPERQRDTRHITHSGGAAPSLTSQTWSVSPSGAERTLPAFGYVTVYSQRAQQGQGTEPARPAVRVERLLRGDGSVGTSAETTRPTVAPAPASLRLTSLDLRQFVTQPTRQEFVSLLLKTYLPVVVSREILSVRRDGKLSSPSVREAAAQGATERRFAHVPAVPGQRPAAQRPAAWTYAGPAPRHAPGGAVEIHRELRSVEMVREHAPGREPLPSLLHVLTPTSLLLSLPETFPTLLSGAAVHTTYQSSELAPTPSLQLVRAHAAPPGTREGAAAARAPRLFDQTPQRQTAGARDVLSSLHTFVERLHSNVAGITHADNRTFFTRGFEQVSARQHGTSSEAATSRATSSNLFGRTVEFVRPASAAEFGRAASTHEAGVQLPPDRGRVVFSRQAAPGAGTFLFTKALLRRSEGGPATLSPQAATALRLTTAAGTERAASETRAARPEGMALELVRQRREEVLQLPRPGYVFTQPQRAQLEERQVITKASREEIVEVVRKEVRALNAATPVMPAPSRAELAGIADEVYSTLVRRLLVEKERLGRF